MCLLLSVFEGTSWLEIPSTFSAVPKKCLHIWHELKFEWHSSTSRTTYVFIVIRVEEADAMALLVDFLNAFFSLCIASKCLQSFSGPIHFYCISDWSWCNRNKPTLLFKVTNKGMLGILCIIPSIESECISIILPIGASKKKNAASSLQQILRLECA